MRQRITALFIATVLLIGLLPVTAAAAEPGTSADNPMTVPVEGMAITGGTYYGILKSWFQTINPTAEKMYFSITIPNNVTKIANDGFKDSYRSEKKSNNAVTSNDNIGRYDVVSLDFSQATSLVNIGEQAAKDNTYLSGVLDLSKTAVTEIGKSAFSGCSNLTGVILPSTLVTLNNAVFNSCSGLEFVRVADGDTTAAFELPDSLITIGNQCFKSAFTAPFDIVIPETVTAVGSEAFYTNNVHTIVVKAADLENYDGGAFKRSSYDKRLIILPNAEAYKLYVGKGTSNSMKEAMTYPYTGQFMDLDDQLAATVSNRLYGQPLNVVFDPVTSQVSTDEAFSLPEAPEHDWGDGYAGGWVFDNRLILEADSEIAYYTYERDKCEDIISFHLQAVVAPPAIVPIVDGEVTAASWDKGTYSAVIANDGFVHQLGVQVTHPLENEPENPQNGDVYVDFRFKWTDVEGSFKGPRSGGKNGVNPEKEFSGWSWDYNTIPICGTDHARSGYNYYMVEIEGYYTVYDAASGKWSNGILFFKTASTVMGGAGEETNYYPAFRFFADVEGELAPVTVTPADITVYMGGSSGYDGVVDENGAIQGSGSLPEPGFYLELPEALNEALRNELGYEPDEAADLSNYIAFHADGKSWTLEPYGSDSYSESEGKYVYRLVAAPEQDPVRVQFKDEGGNIRVDSEFDITAATYTTYEMGIYPGAVDQDEVTATITIGSTVLDEYPVATQTGTLTILAKTEEAQITPVQNDTAVSEAVEHITAAAPADTKYFINDSEIELTDGTPSLLVDGFLDESTAAFLKEKVDDALGTVSENQQYEFKYLDLVDGANANVWLTPDGPVTIYWPYPDGTDQDTEFTILHFDGIGRSMTDEIPADYAPKAIDSAETTEYGIRFTTERFSPFALTWTGKETGGGVTTRYTIRASAGEGGSISPNGSVRVSRGSDKTFAITPDEGYQISDVLVDGESVGAVSSYTFENVKAGHTIEALFRAEHQIADPDDTGVSAWLNTKEHNAYLHGYTDGSFGPGHNMTRAEAAQMFYNLLLDQDAAKTASFDDVASDAWYADAVNTLASIGILQGVGGSRFAPERSITRAEFTAIAMRFAKLDTRGEASFSDVSKDDWFYGQVVGAVRYGWITGYEDGTFRPNHTITRAEAAVLTNRLLARSPDERYVDAHSGGIRQFSDMTSGHWAYYPIMEAANSHDYEKTTNAERWLQTEP